MSKHSQRLVEKQRAAERRRRTQRIADRRHHRHFQQKSAGIVINVEGYIWRSQSRKLQPHVKKKIDKALADYALATGQAGPVYFIGINDLMRLDNVLTRALGVFSACYFAEHYRPYKYFKVYCSCFLCAGPDKPARSMEKQRIRQAWRKGEDDLAVDIEDHRTFNARTWHFNDYPEPLFQPTQI